MRKISLFVLVLILVSTIKLIPVSAQTVTPSLVPTEVPTNFLPTSTPTPTPVVLPVPQGISAVMISDDRIDVSWKSSTGSSAYEVYRNDELVAIVSSLFYSDNGLDAETSYSYKVRAYDGTNYSQYSTSVSATTRSTTAQGTPEPTIPLGPEDNKLKPSVEETHSYVTVGSVKYAYNEIEAFDSGEEFIVLGRSEEYADVEIVVSTMAEPTSYFAKADDDGFWEVSIDTDILETGTHTFKIIISTPDFPEKYESEDYSFEINTKVEPTTAPVAESSFGSRVNRIILIAIVLVVLLFIILTILAVKKGWLKKLKSSPGEGDAALPGENMELNNLIQLDPEAEGASVNAVAPQETLINEPTPISTLPEAVSVGAVDQIQSQDTELVPTIDAVSTMADPTIGYPQQAETSQDVSVMDEQSDSEISPLPEEGAGVMGEEVSAEEESDEADITEMTIDTEDESKSGLNIEEVAPISNEVETTLSDTSTLIDTQDEASVIPQEQQVVVEEPEVVAESEEVMLPEVTQEVSPFVNEDVPSFSSPEPEVSDMSSDKLPLETNEGFGNDYSSTTPVVEGESIEVDQASDDEMVTRDGLYTGPQESTPSVVPEEAVTSETEQEIDENPNDVSGL